MLDRRRLLIILTMIFSAGVTPIAIRITQSEGMPSLVIVLHPPCGSTSLALLPLDLDCATGREICKLDAAASGLLSGICRLLAGAQPADAIRMALEYTSVLMTSMHAGGRAPLWIVLPEILIFGVVFLAPLLA